MSQPSLNGRTFRDVSDVRSGDVGAETTFEYHQHEDHTIWAKYEGGAVRLGYLVGVRTDDSLTFRYVHISLSGETATGRCTSTVEQMPDGRLRMRETWEWESKTGGGTSVVEEISTFTSNRT